MINFPTGTCPKCGRRTTLMLDNNPIGGTPICFDCIRANLDYRNLTHADFFCRTYNLPFNPDLWMQTADEHKEDTFRVYTDLILSDKANQPNLAYASSTHDLWARTNKEWEKTRSFAEILNKLNYIRDSYVTRSAMKWGTKYTFEEFIKLDALYTRTIKANNITNPLQKEAVKTLCKIHIELDEAIAANDAKAIKDFSTAYATFAKQADLEGMIQETRTDDITTVAELYDYMEKGGFQFHYFDGAARDEVDRAITDIQDTNRRLILESTGLQPLLEEMARKRMETAEQEHAAAVTEDNTLEDLLNYNPDDTDIDTESDDEVLAESFEDEAAPTTTINRLPSTNESGGTN